LPMPNFNSVLFEKIENIVKQILNLKQTDNSADTTDLENEINKLVYKLYELTDEEIKIIENN